VLEQHRHRATASGVVDAYGRGASRVDRDRSALRRERASQELSLLGEALLVAGVKERSSAADLEDSHLGSGQSRHGPDRVAARRRPPSRMFAPDEDGDLRAGVDGARHARITGALHEHARSIGEALDDPSGGLGALPRGDESASGSEERARDVVLVVATLAAAEAPGARPR
jgi:hypothetical protein